MKTKHARPAARVSGRAAARGGSGEPAPNAPGAGNEADMQASAAPENADRAVVLALLSSPRCDQATPNVRPALGHARAGRD